jgi:hypothetical protein
VRARSASPYNVVSIGANLVGERVRRQLLIKTDGTFRARRSWCHRSPCSSTASGMLPVCTGHIVVFLSRGFPSVRPMSLVRRGAGASGFLRGNRLPASQEVYRESHF